MIEVAACMHDVQPQTASDPQTEERNAVARTIDNHKERPARCGDNAYQARQRIVFFLAWNSLELEAHTKMWPMQVQNWHEYP